MILVMILNCASGLRCGPRASSRLLAASHRIRQRLIKNIRRREQIACSHRRHQQWHRLPERLCFRCMNCRQVQTKSCRKRGLRKSDVRRADAARSYGAVRKCWRRSTERRSLRRSSLHRITNVIQYTHDEEVYDHGKNSIHCGTHRAETEEVS